MNGFDPNEMMQNAGDADLRKLAMLLKDVGFGPGAAMKRLFSNQQRQLGDGTDGAAGGVGGVGGIGGGGGKPSVILGTP